MILSHDQIRKAARCPDCARREVDIVTCATHEDLHNTTVARAGYCCCFAVLTTIGLPMNVVETLHDSGCPQLINILPGQHTELRLLPVELDDDHQWVVKLAEMGELQP